MGEYTLAKYRIQVDRIVYETTTVYIDADSSLEAKHLAISKVVTEPTEWENYSTDFPTIDENNSYKL